MFEPLDKEPLFPPLRRERELRPGSAFVPGSPPGHLPPERGGCDTRRPAQAPAMSREARGFDPSPPARRRRRVWRPSSSSADPSRAGKFEARNGESRLGSYPGRPALRLRAGVDTRSARGSPPGSSSDPSPGRQGSREQFREGRQTCGNHGGYRRRSRDGTQGRGRPSSAIHWPSCQTGRPRSARTPDEGRPSASAPARSSWLFRLRDSQGTIRGA